MQLLLVRHGQTEWNAARRFQGQENSPLTDLGRRQARLAGQALAPYRIAHSFCSDTGRVAETVAAMREANPSLPEPRRDTRLRELHYGAWEGMLQTEIEAAYPDLYRTYVTSPATFRAPGGESFGDLQERFVGFFRETVPIDDGNVLVVTHGGVVRVAVLFLLGRELGELRSVPSIREASITVLERTGDGWRLVEGSGVRHLDPLRAP
ncbi:MAG TPA: histidine phosphatase family protein [Spirochaetia bacterium]